MHKHFGCTVIAASGLIVTLACTLADAGGAAPKVTAEQLTAAYLKNQQQAVSKYGDAMTPKELIVVGTVEKLVDGTYGKIARLKGTKGAVVSCLLRKQDEPLVKQGEKITIKGRCRGYFPQDKLVDLNGGVVQKSEK